MCPSGSKPFGKSDSNTNSGSVRSSSRDKVNRVPLYMVSLHPFPALITLGANSDSPQIKGDVRLAIHVCKPAL